MNPARRTASVLWRTGLCVLLLGWVFHNIFLSETRLAWQRQGLDWEHLGSLQRWGEAWRYGPADLWLTLAQLRPLEGTASLVFMGLTILLGMLRWRMVLRVQGLDLPMARAGEISLVAHFFNSFLLGSTGGDLMKAYYAARETHHLKTEAAVTVAADRFIGLLSMLVFAAVMMLPNRALLAEHRRLWALAGVVLVLLAGGVVVAGVSFRGGLSRRWPGARAWLRRLPRGDLAERAIEAARRFGREPGFFPRTLAISMLLNVFCVLQYWSLARGLGIEVRPMVLFLLVPVIICISALPITPSGLGVRENLYVWTLSVPGIAVPAAKALSLSLLAYAGSLAWSLVGGLVYVLFRSKHRLREVAHEPAGNGPG